MNTPKESCDEFKKRRTEERIKEGTEKKFHGQLLRGMKETASEKSWNWLPKCHLKKQTECLLMAARSQSLRTKVIKAKIDKTQEDSLRRLCKKSDKTVSLFLSEYKRRHDNNAKAIHCNVIGFWSFPIRVKLIDEFFNGNE